MLIRRARKKRKAGKIAQQFRVLIFLEEDQDWLPASTSGRLQMRVNSVPKHLMLSSGLHRLHTHALHINSHNLTHVHK